MPRATNLVEVVTVQVGIDTEESPENCPDGIPEVLWEGGADLIWEVFFVIKEALGPVHQRVDIFGRGQFRGAFVLYAILP